MGIRFFSEYPYFLSKIKSKSSENKAVKLF